MGTIWFCIVAFMIAMYVLLDGFFLGAGAIHLWVAKTDEERQQVLEHQPGVGWKRSVVNRSGRNDVFRFPRALCQRVQRFLSAADDCFVASDSSWSVDRIPESHQERSVGSAVGFLFCASSLLLAVFFGAALGNVVRGVPLAATGYFFEPLWTNFRLGEETGILDWYTILVGLLALLALSYTSTGG